MSKPERVSCGSRAPWRFLRRVRLALFALGVTAGATAAQAGVLQADERGALREAFAAAAGDEWQRAFRIVAEVQDPLARKTLQWLRLLAGQGTDDFAALAAFITANPDWPLPERTQILAESRIRDPADHALIREFFAERPPLTTRGCTPARGGLSHERA